MTTPSPATTSISHPATIVGDILAIQLSTTTFFPNGTALPVAPSQHSPIPIGSIVGGTIGGIVLAFVLVFGWIWWGRNIERGKRKEKSKILAVLEVRENTRKNASSAVVRDASYFAPAAPSPLPQRSIKFASGSSIASTASTAQLAQALDETKATTSDTTPVRPPPTPITQHPPYRPSPLSSTVHLAKPSEPPTLPTPAVSHRSPRGPHPPPRASIVSTPSNYSAQNGEERQTQVPSSLLVAALESTDPHKSLSAISPAMTLSVSDGPSRLSQVSSGSAEVQPDDHPELPVGYAQ